MSVPLTRRRFTVDEYYRMAEAGILGEDDRVELLDGEIVEMTPIGLRHSSAVDRLTAFFAGRVGERAIVHVQNPIRLGRYEEPQPDLCLLKHRPDFYAQRHPGPEDVLVVVEVTDTSAQHDSRVKVRCTRAQASRRRGSSTCRRKRSRCTAIPGRTATATCGGSDAATRSLRSLSPPSSSR